MFSLYFTSTVTHWKRDLIMKRQVKHGLIYWAYSLCKMPSLAVVATFRQAFLMHLVLQNAHVLQWKAGLRIPHTGKTTLNIFEFLSKTYPSLDLVGQISDLKCMYKHETRFTVYCLELHMCDTWKTTVILPQKINIARVTQLICFSVLLP